MAFLAWLIVALIGEVGLVVSLAGLVVQGSIQSAAMQLAGFPGSFLVSPTVAWWLGLGISVLMLAVGLTGLAVEQRKARGGRRRREVRHTASVRPAPAERESSAA
ncbi:MAG: hypothetical protein ACRDHO_09245 [Actinomycetota bacterium]